jgi:hypothetical protein
MDALNYRIFTVDEANTALDEVIKPAFERLHALLADLAEAEREVSVLRLIATSGADTANPDRARLGEVESRLRAVKTDIREEIETMRATGALVKDLRHGLVDFFALHDEQLVFLCWHRGEDQIRYWHTIEGGFRGRRRLNERAELED